MSEEVLVTPQADIDSCLEIERSVKDSEKALYLECMDGVPLSVRVSNPRPLDREGRDVRDGCILTQMFFKIRRDSRR